MSTIPLFQFHEWINSVDDLQFNIYSICICIYIYIFVDIFVVVVTLF